MLQVNFIIGPSTPVAYTTSDDGVGPSRNSVRRFTCDPREIVSTLSFLALPGTAFLPGDEPKKTGYFRASFSLLHEDEVEEALKRD